MADIDQTNIYSYCGNNFILDFKKYLRDHGITIDEIELMNGMIAIWLTGNRKPVTVPQYARWGDVVTKLGGKSVDLRDADLRAANLRDADLRAADIRDADLRDANLRYANLRDADCRAADLRDADLREADLRDADLAGADFRDTDLTSADLANADLRDADLMRANLTMANLARTNLKGVNLVDADLRDANLRGADLAGADLRGADLRDAHLVGANLTGADLDFSSWPLWCGSIGVKVDKRIVAQLAYHFCGLDCDDPEYQEAREALSRLANQFHRVGECGEIKIMPTNNEKDFLEVKSKLAKEFDVYELLEDVTTGHENVDIKSIEFKKKWEEWGF